MTCAASPSPFPLSFQKRNDLSWFSLRKIRGGSDYGIETLQASEVPCESELGAHCCGLAPMAFNLKVPQEASVPNVVDSLTEIRRRNQQRFPKPVELRYRL